MLRKHLRARPPCPCGKGHEPKNAYGYTSYRVTVVSYPCGEELVGTEADKARFNWRGPKP